MPAPPKTIREYQILVDEMKDVIEELRMQNMTLEDTVNNLMPTASLEAAIDQANDVLAGALADYQLSYPNWANYDFLHAPHDIQKLMDIMEPYTTG